VRHVDSHLVPDQVYPDIRGGELRCGVYVTGRPALLLGYQGQAGTHGEGAERGQGFAGNASARKALLR